MEWSQHPKVQVVIPAFRAIPTIRKCVLAVLGGTSAFRPQIVVADDGDNPGLDRLLSDLPVTIRATQEAHNAATARNLGCQGFYDGILVFIDADVVVKPGAIENLIAPLLDGCAAAAVGNYSRDVRQRGFAEKYKQLYISHIYSRRRGDIRNEFWTAIGAVDAAVFHRLGGFNEHLPGAIGEDTDLGIRLTAAGYRICGVQQATGQHLHRFTPWKLIVNDWRKGGAVLSIHTKHLGRLSDHRHATARDMLSVALAVAAAMAACLLPFDEGLAVVVLLLAYLLSRSDVLAGFRKQSVWFLFCAFWTMLVLDLVRASCVVWHWKGMLGQLKPRFQPVNVDHA